MSPATRNYSYSPSPTPIRDTQPQFAPTTVTTKGTVPGQALYDTPPPGTQTTGLTRSQRTRVPTARKKAQLETEVKPKGSRPASPPLHPATSRKRRKTAALVIQSPEASDGEQADPSAGKTSNEGAAGQASQGGPPAGDTSMARSDESQYTWESQPVNKADLARDLGQFLNRDFTNASTQVLYETAKAIAEDNSIPIGLKGRYSQVIASPAVPLKVGGGYIRNRLNDLIATSETPFTSKRPNRSSSTNKQTRNVVPDDEHLAGRNDNTSTPPPASLVLAKPRSQPTPSTFPSRSHNIHVSPVPQPGAGASPAFPPSLSARPSRTFVTGRVSPVPVPRVGLTSWLKLKPKPKPDPTSNPAPESCTESESEPTSQPKPLCVEPRAPLSIGSGNTRTTSKASQQLPSHTMATRTSNLAGPVVRAPATMDPSVTDRGRSPDVSGLSGAPPPNLEEAFQWVLHFAKERSHATQAPDSSGQCGNTASAGPSRHNISVSSDLHSSFHHAARARTPREKKKHARYPRIEQPALTAAEDDMAPSGQDFLDGLEAAALGALAPASIPGKTGLGKYPELHRVATFAILDMLATVCAKGVYQPTDTYRRWATHAYRRQWKLRERHKEFVPPPEDLITTMVDRISWLRTTTKSRVRIVVRYGYGFKHPIRTEEDLVHNLDLYDRLWPNSFHCRDLKLDQHQYEHEVFRRAFAAAYFQGKDGLGVTFGHMFNPMPLPASAFVLTMMQTCVEEWKSGTYEPRDLRANRQEPIFDAHLSGLHEYAKAACVRLTRFQKEWYQFAASCASVSIDVDDGREFCQTTTTASKVRPDTPDPDRAGRYTAQAKAKGRAGASPTNSEDELEADPDAGLDTETNGWHDGWYDLETNAEPE